jgi:hypothetical protein
MESHTSKYRAKPHKNQVLFPKRYQKRAPFRNSIPKTALFANPKNPMLDSRRERDEGKGEIL